MTFDSLRYRIPNRTENKSCPKLYFHICASFRVNHQLKIYDLGSDDGFVRMLDIGRGRGERPDWIAFLQPTVNGRFGEVVLQCRDVVTALTERQWQNMLHPHQAGLPCVDGVCFARENCVDCAVGQYSPVFPLPGRRFAKQICREGAFVLHF